MRRCGIDKPGACHLFRHSCVTDMHRGGADRINCQQLSFKIFLASDFDLL